MDIEEAYDLIDAYSLECERCVSVKQVSSLQYNALINFASRINEIKSHQGYSKVTLKAISYIKRNIYKIKTIMDVVSYIGVSKSSLSEKFKKDTGTSLGYFINSQKNQEAKRMLQYENISVFKISDSLGFANQSYFQNVFKKETGMTPLKYRKSFDVKDDIS